ncbi:hypothetical protein DL96DRAFT_1612131 [Flagelloscypha sp. PMI_526]|nr:hypothetical protein DL96DRAFT_1612131 [Flagelloscypha sp. PMI_526]
MGLSERGLGFGSAWVRGKKVKRCGSIEMNNVELCRKQQSKRGKGVAEQEDDGGESQGTNQSPAVEASLPPELLAGEIFRYVVLNDAYRRQPKAALDTLCLVSSNWTSLVLACPLLWTHICIPQQGEHPLSILQLGLERSGDLPFCITLTLDSTDVFTQAAMPDVVTLLIQYRNRLQTLRIGFDLDLPTTIHPLFAVPSYPLLKEILIVRRLGVRPTILSSYAHLPFPINGLTELELRDSRPEDMDIFKDCPNLVRLGLYALTPVLHGDSSTFEPIILSSVRSLTVELHHQSIAGVEYFELELISVPVNWPRLFRHNPIFTRLHTLKLVNISTHQITHTFFDSNVDFLLLFSRLRKNPSTSTEILDQRSRRNSMLSNFFNSQARPHPNTDGGVLFWQNLNTITMHALDATEVVWLLNLLLSSLRPLIRTVNLSPISRAHLKKSLFFEPSWNTVNKVPWGSNAKAMDCEEHLKRRRPDLNLNTVRFEDYYVLERKGEFRDWSMPL